MQQRYAGQWRQALRQALEKARHVVRGEAHQAAREGHLSERRGRQRQAPQRVAQAVEQQIIGLAGSGRLQRAIDDATLRAILARIMPERREIKITRR